MQTIRQQVREFMKAAEQPVYDEPRKPTKEEIVLRLKLIAEETVELLDACYMNDAPHLVMDVRDAVEKLLETPPDDEWDAELVADALADIDYVVEGARQTFGFDGRRIANEVHRANMEKFGPGSYKREDGKQMKPPNWRRPEIQTILNTQNRPPSFIPPLGEPSVYSYRGFEVRAHPKLTQFSAHLHNLSAPSDHRKMLDAMIDSAYAPIDHFEAHPYFILIHYKNGITTVWEVGHVG